MTTVQMTYVGRRYLWTRHKLVHAFKVGTRDEVWLAGKPKFAEIGRVYDVEQVDEQKYKIDRGVPVDTPVDASAVQEWRLADRAAYLEHSAMATRKRLAEGNKHFGDLTLSEIRNHMRLEGPAQRAAIITAVLTTLEGKG